MNNNDTIFLVFIVYLAGMIAIGAIASHQTRNLSDFILGGRRLGKWTTALSAGASDMSGWLLLGLPGYAYMAGLEALWIALGLFIGTWLNWQLVAPRLRVQSEQSHNAMTIPEYLESRFNDKTHLIRLVSAFFILLFFTFYTSSGLVAGGKLFETVFGLPYHMAVLTGTAAILIYTVTGGFLAVSWTDLIQALLMLLALACAALLALYQLEGVSVLLDKLQHANPALIQLFTTTDQQHLGWIAIVSLLGWGLGYFGQPHILVRFMAIQTAADIQQSKMIALSWTFLSLITAILIGLCGIILLPETLNSVESETVFIKTISLLFHPVPAGICLAAILAAIMSTADSQLLVAASAISEDMYKIIIKKEANETKRVLIGRMAVILIAVIASCLALQPDGKVLELVAYAWAGFGAAFGPVMILSLYWKRMSARAAMAGIVTGALTVIIWKQFTTGLFTIYELVPGFLFSLLAIALFTYCYPDKTGLKNETR